MPTGWAPQIPFDILFMFAILIFNWGFILRKTANIHQILVKKCTTKMLDLLFLLLQGSEIAVKRISSIFFPVALKKSVAFKYAFLLSAESCPFLSSHFTELEDTNQ